MVPEGWSNTILREHLREPIRNGYSPICPSEPTGDWTLSLSAVTPTGFNKDGTKPAPLDDSRVASARLTFGDIVVSRSNTRERVGLAGIYQGEPSPCSYPDLLMRVRCGATLDPGFLLCFLLGETGRRYFTRSARGTSGSMVKIDRAILENVPLLLPPLREQKGIAEVLSSLDRVVESSRAVVKQLQTVKKALLSDFLAEGTKAGTSERQESGFGKVPARWRHVRLGDVANAVRRPVAVLPDVHYREIGVRSHGKGVFHKEPVSGAELGNKRVFEVEPQCVVVNIVFAWEGAVAITSEAEAGMIASHRFPMLQSDSAQLDVQYLRLLLQSEKGIELLASISPGGAGRNRTLNQRSLMRLELPLPPIHEQRGISSAVVAVEHRISAEHAALEQQQNLKAALSTALLTGEIRVPLSPSEQATP